MIIIFDFYNTAIYNYVDGLSLHHCNKPIICHSNGLKSTRGYKTIDKDAKIDSEGNKQLSKSTQQYNKAYFKSKNLIRSKQAIYNLSRSNHWDFFGTITFSVDRYDYQVCKKRLLTFFNHIKNRSSPDFCYLAIPELHKDGAIHFHCLFSGISPDIITLGFKGLYSFNNFRFGHSELSIVKDTCRVSSYITKYITKDIDTSITFRRYYYGGFKPTKPQKLFLSYSVNDVLFDKLKDYDLLHSYNSVYGDKHFNYLQFKKKG